MNRKLIGFLFSMLIPALAISGGKDIDGNDLTRSSKLGYVDGDLTTVGNIADFAEVKTNAVRGIVESYGYVTKTVTNGLATTAYVNDKVARATPGDYQNVSNKAYTALQASDVINNVTSTTTTKPLSAKMGKELQDQISNLKQRGRYLSVWNATNGLPVTTPTVNPYIYKAGDYFIVGFVGTNLNYRPVGAAYTNGVPSRVAETQTLLVNDTYYFDGTSWSLLQAAQKEVSFAGLAGSPYDNTNLASALNGKQDVINDYTSTNAVRDIVTGYGYVTEAVTNGLESATHAAATYQPKGNYLTEHQTLEPSTNFTRAATNDLATTLRGEIAAHAPGNYAAVSNAAMTAVQPAALDSYATWEWVATPSSTFAGTAAKNLPATYSEGFGWTFSDSNPLTIDGSLSILGDNYWLWISGGWGNLQAGSAWQTLPEYITERTSDFLSTSWAEEPGSYFSGTASAAIGADFSTVAQKVAREVMSSDTECIYFASNDRWAAKDSGGNDHTFAYVSELPTWVEKANELQFLENGPRLTFDSNSDRWVSIWQGRNTFAYVSDIPSTNGFIKAETDPIWSANSNNFATALLDVAERTTESKISATYPAFSNAVLAVGLNIDTNSVAVLNEIAASFGGFPLSAGETATTVGGLLAALAAAVAWLKRKTAEIESNVGTANNDLESALGGNS